MPILIIIGAVLLLGIFFAVLSAKNTVIGFCPKCNTKIGLRKGIGCCSKCGEPLRKENDHFVPVGPNFVADNFSFSISMGKLKNPKQWPSKCKFPQRDS